MGEGGEFGIDSEDFQDKDQRKFFLNLSSPSSPIDAKKLLHNFVIPDSIGVDDLVSRAISAPRLSH